jgi:MFS family permease
LPSIPSQSDGVTTILSEVDPQHANRKPADSRRDLILVYAARAARNFGDGFAVILLPAYLQEIGFGPAEIGVVAAAALLGSAVLTLAMGFLAARWDPRTLLLAGAFLMVATGLTVPNLVGVVTIAVAVFIGTMNPTTGDVGVLVPIEHALLAREARDEERTRVFAHYSLIGAIATAAGALAAAVPSALQFAGFGALASLRVMFYAYAGLGLAGAAFYCFLPKAEPVKQTKASDTLGPSRGVVYKLAVLFSLDAFAGGFAVQSLIALWLFQWFALSLSAASLFFFWSNVLSALSYPVAARLAKRFGLVNTMVFTHLPASFCLILVAFTSNLALVMTLLLIRAALSQMDVPTRTSYVMAVVTPQERPMAASVTTVSRSLASSLSPALAGFLLTMPFSALPFVLCGALKIVYDLSLLLSFRHVKPPEEATLREPL